VLTANGYSYFLRDGVIVVKPADAVTPGELKSRIVTLRYLDPVTAVKALEPVLSDKGRVVILDKVAEGAVTPSIYRANRILVTELPAQLPGIIDVIEQMDVPERVILIEAKIIETKLDDRSKLGFLWPTTVTTKLSGADDGTVDNISNGSTINDRTAASSWDPNNGTWSWGKLSVNELSAVLHMLEEDGNSKLVSDPRLTTLENHEAEIKIATVIPIQTINRFTEAAATADIVTFQDEEVGITLRVTPRINEEGTITLDVVPSVEDIIGYVGTPENQKPITSERSIRTTITVKEGETAALGGLLKDDEIETKRRVPLLGHIPLLGKLLFTNTSKEKSTSDLIILITPTILN
jgi:general secretion pathway protein D